MLPRAELDGRFDGRAGAKAPPAGITMVTHDPSGRVPDGFSPELAHEVSVALNDYLLSSGTEAETRLRALTNRVCAEAHALGLPPEKMLIAIKQLFERAPLSDVINTDSRRRAFEKFVSGCIKTYFDADRLT